MSGFDKKRRGPETGVTAAQVVDSGPVFTPGRVNPLQTYDVGVAYVDRGPKCAHSGAPGCFLDADKRGRLIQMVMDEANVAQNNYKFALEEMRVDKLIEKDDDLSWVVSMALDLATSHIAGMASKALNKIKSQNIARLSDMNIDIMGTDAGHEDVEGDQQLVAALKKVSDKSVTAATKAGFDLAKKQGSKAMKTLQNAEVKDDKTETMNYLDQLKTQCDVGFQAFKQTGLANASDAELIVMLQGLAAEYQSIGAYKAALTEKLARYKKSGVPEIGQKAMTPAEAHVTTMYASKRCVWLRNVDGSKTLWTYHVISGNQTNPWGAGDPNIERVPDEFLDAAVTRSEEKWGPTPTFDDPANAIAAKLRAPQTAEQPAAAPKPVPFIQLSDSSRKKKP